MDADTLELASDQVLAPVDDDAVEPLLSQRTLTALRRRFPRGSGLFLLTGSGDLFFDPGRGMAPIALVHLAPETASAIPR